MRLKIIASIPSLRFIWKWNAGTEDSPHLLLLRDTDGITVGRMKWEEGWKSSKGCCWLYDVNLDYEFQGQGIGKSNVLVKRRSHDRFNLLTF